MWVKLGNSVLVNSDDFSCFLLVHDSESIIYGVSKNDGVSRRIWLAESKEQGETYFGQLQKAMTDRDEENQTMRKILWQPPD